MKQSHTIFAMVIIMAFALFSVSSLHISKPVILVADQTHYGDPYVENCLSDEVNITIQGVAGAACVPKCAAVTRKCPTDVPTGVTSQPQCALSDANSGAKFCALLCDPNNNVDTECGSDASCKSISGTGICTYNLKN